MGLFKKLAGLGVAAGAVVAGLKIADKYKQNNPEGLQPKEGETKVRPEDVLGEVKKAAAEVYNDAAVAVKAAADNAPEYIEMAKAAAKDVVDNAPEYIEKAKAAAKDVVDSAPEYIEMAKAAAKDVVDSIKAPQKGEPIIELDFEDVKEEILDAAEELKEKVDAVKDIIDGE